VGSVREITGEKVEAAGGEVMNIYISSSWKQRERVRALAIRLRVAGHEVYDFTDPACRNTVEIPPERFPEQFDPSKHVYHEYINVPEWRSAVECNRQALELCNLCVLLLPCGNDAHADWAYAVGAGIRSAVVGQPRAGERTPSHMWADAILPDESALMSWLAELAAEKSEHDRVADLADAASL